jgi:hypothetical protein
VQGIKPFALLPHGWFCFLRPTLKALLALQSGVPSVIPPNPCRESNPSPCCRMAGFVFYHFTSKSLRGFW